MKTLTFWAGCRKAALTVICVAASAGMFAFPQQAAAKKKKIGIQLYSVMGAMQKDPAGSIERLSDMGYNVAELVQWGGDTKVFGLEPAEFKAICDRNGMEIVSTHTGIQEDPAKEEEVIARWRRIFEIQKACGGRYVVIPSYGVDYTEKGVQQMCDYFNRIGKIASEYGLKLGYHNHSGEFGKLKDSGKVMWEYLVEHTDPSYVFFELDVYWCSKGGKDPVAYLKKYPNRIRMLHVKDDFVIGASGTIDFEAIFDQFYANGMKDYVVEIEIPGWLREERNAAGEKLSDEEIMAHMFEAAKQSAKYLSKAKFVK